MPRYPYTTQGVLYPAERLEPIVIGTSAWSTWISEHTTFAYQDAPIHFTARREQRPGGLYWYAYKRVQGKLLKRYLGRGEDLTLQSLHDIAHQFALSAEGSSHNPSASTDLPIASFHRPTTLLVTKFHIPGLPVHHIARSRLLNILDEGMNARLTLVCAPAGSGKTTLLSSWARTTVVPVAWLSLEEADNDPLRFLSYLMAAFTRIIAADTHEPKDTTAFTLPSTLQGTSWEELLVPFVNDLAHVLTKDTVLILDDYHLITSEPIHAALRFFIEHMPAQLHLLIGTRNDPLLPLARLRVRGQLLELRTEDLCFVPAEVEAFVDAMGLILSGEARSLLEQRTEGWIAGIQLLALALRGRVDASAFLRASAGATHHFLLDYVSEEILAQQTPEMQHFLLRTCILARMTGPLCDAVTGLSDGQTRLADLLRANLFVSALDDAQIWYRYHPLFAETLRAHLQKLEPALIPELYLRASRWYEQHQDMEEACEYVLLAGDFSHAAKLVAELLPQMVEQGRFEQLGRWLRQLPPAIIAASPQLYIVTPWMYSLSQRLPTDLDQTLKHMEQHVQKQQQDTQSSWVEPKSVLTLFQALTALSRNDLPRAFMQVREALRVLTTRETALSQLILRFLKISLSIMYGMSGDLATAEQILLELGAIQSTEAFSLINLAAPFLLGELYKAQGQLRKAEALYESLALAFRSSRDVPPMPLLVMGFSLMRKSSLWYEWNCLPEAASEIQQVLEMLPRAVLEIIPRATQPSVLAFGLWAQARIEWAQGRPDAAMHFLDLVRNQPKMMGELPPGKERPPLDVPTLAARLALICDQIEDALHWEITCGIRVIDAPITLLEGRRVFVYLTLARVLIARGRSQPSEEALSQALILLGPWRDLAERLDLQGWLIEIQMLTSLAFQAQGKTRQALTTLGAVLAQAEPEGYVRLFADEGQPMAHLLAHISAYTTASPNYIQRLQTAIPPKHQPLLSSARSNAPTSMLDPLSGREREVLSLLTTGASNQQIADRLVISLNTAKRHVKNIIAKLNVTNRTQAVARARDLHLL